MMSSVELVVDGTLLDVRSVVASVEFISDSYKTGMLSAKDAKASMQSPFRWIKRSSVGVTN